MPRIGLRHLSTHTSEVIRDVQENRERYVITNRGEPVAVVIPYAPYEEVDAEERRAAWNELADLLEEAGRLSQSTETAQETMDWLRRY